MEGKINMNNWFEDQCNQAFLTGSDINQHIPTLYFLANQCDHVTELGVRWGTSSKAFLFSKARLRSYDIEITPEARALFDQAKALGKDVEIYQQDSLTIPNFETTDLLFIDTFHAYSQAIQELKLYHSKVRKWIVLHDTELFGDTGQDGTRGLKHAVNEFISLCPEWNNGIIYQNNNGLTVLRRQ